jgi:type II secretory pathway pseudopilin PulG
MFLRPRTSAGSRKKLRADTLRSSKGLTLLELLIAFLILQVALIAFAQFITKALDYSRQVRQVEMAQILAQAKMEGLIRTLSTQGAPAAEMGGETVVLNNGPGIFNDVAYGRSEDIDPFRWVAEAKTSETNSKLLNLTLRVYTVRRRVKADADGKDEGEDVEDFFVSEDKERFTYTYRLPDGSVEIMVGKQKLTVASAVALPQNGARKSRKSNAPKKRKR